MREYSKQDIKFYKEYNEFDTPGGRYRDDAGPDLYQEMIKRNQGNIKVLALDLEWTLITEAVSPMDPLDQPVYIEARAGLYDFLESVKDMFDRVVIFTAVMPELFRRTAKVLVAEKKAPAWFADIEYIKWSRIGHKDLSYIPGIEPHQALLVDDYRLYVKPSQLFQWIEIPGYKFWNYYFNDYQLNKVLGIIEMIQLGTIKTERVLEYLKPKINDCGSGVKRCWLCGPITKGKAEPGSTLKVVLEIDEKESAERLKTAPLRSIMKSLYYSIKNCSWANFELISYQDLDASQKKKLDEPGNSILIVNEWEEFHAVLTRTQGGIEIKFPDLPGCTGFCPHDGSEEFDKFTIQAIKPANKILNAWIQAADEKDIPEKPYSKEELKKQFPNSSISTFHACLPWRKE